MTDVRRHQSTDVIGFIDGVADGEIFGWALDRSAPAEPVLLTVLGPSDHVMKLLAVEYRPDVAATFGSKGLNGFRIRIPSGSNNADVSVSVLSEAGNHLTNSPIRVGSGTLRRSPTRNDREQECVLFMHIQKTSGTAFRDAITANYLGSECLYFYPLPPGIWHEQFRRIPREQMRNYKFIIGHFVFGIHTKIDSFCTYVTFVRDPVARVVSHYDHMIRNHLEELKSPMGDFLSLAEVLESRTVAELDNLIVRCFSGNGARHCPAGTVGLDAYEAALENLRHFRFIGHQERSEEGWRNLQRKFGWQHGSLGRANLGEARDGELDRRTRVAIEHFCKLDIMLYRRILSYWPV